MKRIQRMVALLICLLMFVALFVGCGSDKTVVASDESTKADTAKADTAEADVPKEVVKEKIRVTFWDMETVAPEFKAIVDAYNSESKTVEVEPVNLPGSGTDYQDKTAIMLAAGEDIDAITIKDLPQYSGCIMKNQLLALDDMITKANFDLKPYGSNIDVLKINGKIMAIPYRSDFYILFYNKEIFDNAKIPYPTDDTTWEWYRETAKKLTSGEGNNKIWGTYFHTWENTVADFCTATRKGDLISGSFGYLKPAYEMVMGMQQDDKSAMTFAAAKTSKAHYLAMFETGKVGMHVMGTWHIGQLINDVKAEKTKIKWGIAKAPHFADNKPGTTVGNLTPVAITEYTKKAASAFEFVQFMTGEKGSIILGQRGLMPGYRNQTVLDTISSADGFPKENKSALETADVVQQLLPHKNASQMKKILGEENELILTKAETIDEGLKKLDERTKDLAADNK